MRTRSPLRGRSPAVLLFALWSMAGCGADRSAGPDEPRVAAARGGNGGGGASPTVTSTSPSEAPQDVTLDVQVFGTNFDAGSKVDLLLAGKTTTTVKTNSTRFVTTTQLEANLTIAVDAVPTLYDVRVTASNGKKGIGIERFAVTGQLADLATRPPGTAPAGLYQDGLGTYDRGLIGSNTNPPGNFNIQPDCLRQRSMDLVPPASWVALLPPPPQISTCDEPSSGSGRRVQLHFPGLGSAACPDGTSCPIGGQHDPNTSYSPDVYYFFHVDDNNDGKYGPPRDDTYNVVWSDAVFSVLRRALGGTPCRWHIVGSTARLWRTPQTGLDADRPVALDVTVTRTDGVCA